MPSNPIQAFYDLNNANQYALDEVYRCRDIHEFDMKTLEYRLGQMRNACFNILSRTTIQKDELERLNEQAQVAIKKLFRGLEQANADLKILDRIGYQGVSLYEANHSMIKSGIETLSDALQNPKSEYFSLENCVTAHDYIRFFHQKGVEVFYEGFLQGNGGRENPANKKKVVRGKRITFQFYDLCDLINPKNEKLKAKQIKAHKDHPLRTLLDYDDITQNEITVYSVMQHNSAFSQLNLGCHFADISCTIDPEQGIYRTGLRFTDTTSFSASEQRTQFIRKVIENLGVTPQGKGNIVRFNQEFPTPKEALRVYRETLRLLASSKDLDTSRAMRWNWEKAVDLFFKGHINLRKKLG